MGNLKFLPGSSANLAINYNFKFKFLDQGIATKAEMEALTDADLISVGIDVVTCRAIVEQAEAKRRAAGGQSKGSG